MEKKVAFILFTITTLLISSCSKKTTGGGGSTPPTDTAKPVTPSVFASGWVTTTNQSQLLSQQSAQNGFSNVVNGYPTILVDSTDKFQSVDGFGYTLTDGSAELIHALPAAARNTLLRELFSADANAINISCLRISIGASDLSAAPYTYDDLSGTATDPSLASFSIAPALAHLVPVLKEIIAINPAIKIMGSPWTAPAWMKTNNSFTGGSLKPEYYSSYANYFVKYLNAMKAEGISVYAITPQNEPLHGGNNPSMLMTAAEQKEFIRNHLGPAFQAASIPTKIIIYDHNCDRPDYPLEILADASARSFVDGSAFHLYAGDISALSAVKSAHPDKQVYFTEQWTSSTGDFGGDLKWHLKNVIIGSMRNWSKMALEWNLANDAGFGPHTPGGCTQCKGALTISGSSVARNVSYYIVSHASKFVPAGSVRIGSNISGSLQNVAFVTPAGKKVLIVENDGSQTQSFNVKFKDLWFTTSLEAGSVATYVW
ncbi:MAG TPA: glycoside hydrolase family 30 beta sandwich domain-containing protein [Chitinophagaceae bacterium]